MSTKLESLLIRESSETADDRNILVALTPDQRISFRLKGMKSGHVSIPIKELYLQLIGAAPHPAKSSLGKMASSTAFESTELQVLQRLRTLNATTPGKMDIVARIDELTVDLLEKLGK